MRHMKLPLAKSGFLLSVDVGCIRARLGCVWRLEVLGHASDLRQVLQFEWVIVGVKSNDYIFEACL